MKLNEIADNLDELKIDNKHGWGSVPNNQNVDYLGLRVAVRPSMFLKLAHRLDRPFTASDIEQHIRSGGSIGSPFLVIAIPQDWFDGDLTMPAEVYGHEGRNRMIATLKAEGDEPVETHLFFGSNVRNRHLTPDIIDRLNRSIISQQGGVVNGPWFSMPGAVVAEEADDGHTDKLAELLGNVADSFRQGHPYDALEWIEDSNFNVNSTPALKALVDANMHRIGKMVVDELRHGDIDAHIMARIRDMLEGIGVEMPNPDLADQLYSVMGRIERGIANAVQHGFAGDAIDIVDELNEWGINISIEDVMDPEESKDALIREILIHVKKDRIAKAENIIGHLRAAGVDWKELDTIERSLRADTARLAEIAKVRISKDPEDFGAYVDDEGDPEPTVMLPIDSITNVLEPDDLHQTKPGAPRKIASMVRAIRHGRHMPAILVRRQGDGYQVLDGHHRFKAYRLAKAGEVPARIVDPENITGDIDENFADGKGPGRPGDSQRHGIPKGATMAQLRKAAKAPGRKGQLARWQINMRRGRAKAEEGIDEGAWDTMTGIGKQVAGMAADLGKAAANAAYDIGSQAADSVGAFGRSAADTATLGGYKYARAGADYIAKQALKNVGYGSGTTYDRELRQEIEKLARDELSNPRASGAGRLAGVVGAAAAPEIPVVGGVAAGGYRAGEVAQKAAIAYKYARQMLGMKEGEVIQTKFATRKASSGRSPYVFNPDIAATIPLYDPEKRFGVSHKRPDSLQGGEIPFDRFEVNRKSERTSDIVGVIGNKRVVVSTTRPDVADVLADAWNRGGFTATDIEMVGEAETKQGAALTVFDMDETLFHTKARIYVVKDGDVIHKLSNQEYNTYQLKPGETFDYREFRDAKFFHDTSVPIERMWRKAQNILDNIGKRPGSRVIIVTARTDLDDRETFLNTFRKHGLDIDKVHVHRAGNLPVPAASAKKAIIATYLNTGKFDSVRLFDDAESNLRSFLSLQDDYPGIRFTAYLVLPGGHLAKYQS